MQPQSYSSNTHFSKKFAHQTFLLYSSYPAVYAMCKENLYTYMWGSYE